jgi:integrase
MARLYGTGSLRLRKSKKHPDGEFWLRYYAAGQQRHENSTFCVCHDGPRAKSSAEKELLKRIGKGEAGTLPSPRANRTLVEDLAAALFKMQRAELLRKIPENLPASTREWRVSEAERVIKEARARWDNHLAPAFGHRKASLVTKADMNEYVAARLEAEARHATVNREMALLRRMFRAGHAIRPRLVSDVPEFPAKLAESARTGYVEDEAFQKLRHEINEPGLAAMILCAYRLGFRKSELQNMLVVQVSEGKMRLFKGATKNSQARVVVMPDDVRAVVEACCAGKASDAYVFTWKDGSPILDFRGSWTKATKAAGVPKLLFHDLRRSAVRRMLRRGVPVQTAMKISGHLTRTVFDMYDVTGEADLVDAAKLL